MNAFRMAANQDRKIPKPPLALDWLGLAAAPTFLLMAWITIDDVHALHHAATPDIVTIGSMTWMYLLMALFHLSAWTSLVAGLRRQITSQHPAKEIEYATRNR